MTPLECIPDPPHQARCGNHSCSNPEVFGSDLVITKGDRDCPTLTTWGLAGALPGALPAQSTHPPTHPPDIRLARTALSVAWASLRATTRCTMPWFLASQGAVPRPPPPSSPPPLSSPR